MSNNKKQDGQAIGIGPFVVPGVVSFMFETNILNIMLENPTKKQLTATVMVNQSANNNLEVYGSIYPNTDVQTKIFKQTVTLLPKNSTILAISIAPYNTYSVAISGDVGVADDDSGRKMLVSIQGGVKGEEHNLVVFAEPTLCFGYEKFFRVDVDED